MADAPLLIATGVTLSFGRLAALPTAAAARRDAWRELHDHARQLRR